VVAGIIAGLLAVVATVLVYASEDAFTRLPVQWMWWPAIGGVVIGVGGLFVPQALGVGYDVIDAELGGSIGLGLVTGVLVVKTLIWSLSLGSGTSGGVLAPMFMVGGALGSLEAHLFPVVGTGFWPLVGLAGVLGGVMRSPLTGVVFAIELTGRLDALLPLLIAASAAYAISVLTLKRSVLTEKIARRGYHLTREYDVDPLEVLFVHDVMTTDVVSFHVGEPIDDVLATFVSGRHQLRDPQHRQRLYPVVDDLDLMHGVLTRRDVLDQALADAPTVALVDELTLRDAVIAYPDETLRTVAYRMASTSVTRVPVLERATGRVLGLISIAQLLQGRLRDLREARDAEQVIRFKQLMPSMRRSCRSRTRL
jgi:chloride channel protein, CIC family